MNISLFNFPNISNRISFGAKKVTPNDVINNVVDKTPTTDVFVPNPQNAEPVSEAKVTSPIQNVFSGNNSRLIKDFHKVVKENILGRELTSIIFAGVDLSKENPFTDEQIKIIKLAAKRIDFFKECAQTLEKDAKSYLDEILNITQEAFGGEQGLGKYVKAREKNGVPSPKDSVSIYNKMIKEYKDEYIKGLILDGVSIPNFGKPYNLLDKDEKKLIKLYATENQIKSSIDYKALESVLKITNKSRKEATNWIRDLVGLRLVLPDSLNMKEVEKYIVDAAISGKLNITKVSNYHSSHIHPYIGKDTLKLLQESLPGLLVVRNADVRKKNGYTTTQMNIVFPMPDKKEPGKTKYINCELQIRSQSLNKIGQIEHLIYDILENKDISKGIPELKEFYDATGIVKAVNEVFNDSKKEEAYLQYEKTVYSKIRKRENAKSSERTAKLEYPLLADFGLGAYDVLSFESLEYIDNKANLIKKKYGIKN